MTARNDDGATAEEIREAAEKRAKRDAARKPQGFGAFAQSVWDKLKGRTATPKGGGDGKTLG